MLLGTLRTLRVHGLDTPLNHKPAAAYHYAAVVYLQLLRYIVPENTGAFVLILMWFFSIKSISSKSLKSNQEGFRIDYVVCTEEEILVFLFWCASQTCFCFDRKLFYIFFVDMFKLKYVDTCIRAMGKLTLMRTLRT